MEQAPDYLSFSVMYFSIVELYLVTDIADMADIASYLQISFQYLEAESGAILSLVFTTQSGLVITTFTQPESKPELFTPVTPYLLELFQIKWQLQAKKRTCRGRFISLWFPSPKFYKRGFIKDNLQKHRMVSYAPKKSIG
jgi:hypothetical protein